MILIKTFFLRLIAISILAFGSIYADSEPDTTKSSFERFLERLYAKPKFVKNKPTLNFYYAPSVLSFSGGKLNTDLAKAYMSGVDYGFTRFNDRIEIEDCFYHSAEFVFVRNLSSHFKPEFIKKDGITSDGWHFGAGMKNGHGYFWGGHRAILYHSGSLMISHMDIEQPADNISDELIFEEYDGKPLLSSSWNAGIEIQIAGPAYLDIGYEHTIVYTNLMFGKWFAGWMVENVSQRWLDFFEDDLIEIHGRNYPWLRFLVKNALSLALYELRRKNMYWPIKSEEPLNYDSFKIGINFIF